MAAGESIDIITEWDFRLADVPKDWSMTVYGNMGGVSISHTDGVTVTDHMPLAPPKRDCDKEAILEKSSVDFIDFRGFVEYFPRANSRCSDIKQKVYTDEAG